MARSRKSVDELTAAALAAVAAAAAAAAAADPDAGTSRPDPSPAPGTRPAEDSRPAGDARPAPGKGPWAVGFSGGLDSTVLLHALVRVAGASRVLALHVDHGLQTASGAWAAHCEAVCARLGVRCLVLRAEGAPARGDSVERWARTERYRLLRAAAREARAAALLTAHHADDQLETVLLALARGSGLDGLTGIAARDVRHGVVLLRPLLALDRAALEADARARGLEWVEDPSNADPAFARNALRARAMPALRAALPGLAAQLPDALALLAQARGTLDALAQADLAGAVPAGPGPTGAHRVPHAAADRPTGVAADRPTGQAPGSVGKKCAEN